LAALLEVFVLHHIVVEGDGVLVDGKHAAAVGDGAVLVVGGLHGQVAVAVLVGAGQHVLGVGGDGLLTSITVGVLVVDVQVLGGLVVLDVDNITAVEVAAVVALAVGQEVAGLDAGAVRIHKVMLAQDALDGQHIVVGQGVGDHGAGGGASSVTAEHVL